MGGILKPKINGWGKTNWVKKTVKVTESFVRAIRRKFIFFSVIISLRLV